MKNCKSCKWAKWQRTPKGNIRREVAGRCEYKVEWPPIPYAQIYPRSDKISIWPKDGAACPCHSPEAST